jgi:hypothetical protein
MKFAHKWIFLKEKKINWGVHTSETKGDILYPTKNKLYHIKTAYNFVKLKVKVKFAVEQATKAHSGSKRIALPFL